VSIGIMIIVHRYGGGSNSVNPSEGVTQTHRCATTVDTTSAD